jgi:hypothetical protein
MALRPSRSVIVIPVLVGGLLGGSQQYPSGQKLDAAAVLTAARNAIGGDAKVRGLKSLRLTGSHWSSQWVIGGRVQTLDLPMQVRMAFPSRFVWIMAQPVSPIESRNGFDGERVISTLNGKPTSPSPYTKQSAELLLLLLARTESWGGLSLDAISSTAIQVRGPDAYTARLEFEPTTRLPSRLIYRERRQIRLPKPSAGNAGGQSGGGGGGVRGLENLPEVEMIVALHDRRLVDGFLLPLRITTSAQGVNLWELRFEEIVVNPPLAAADFAP